MSSAEGVATYDGLYVANECLPVTSGGIRSGLAYGDNYNDSANTSLQVMMRAKFGLPKHLLWELLCSDRSLLYPRKIQRPRLKDGESAFCVYLRGSNCEAL